MLRVFASNKKHSTHVSGLSLVELLVTMLISSIAMSGMVLAYIDGLEYWRRASEKMVLFNEGSAALKIIENKVAQAKSLKFLTGWKVPGDQMDVIVTTDGYDTKKYQFYYQVFDNTIRWNNLIGDVGIFNIRLLPVYAYIYQPGEKPYLNIESVSFTPFDPKRPVNPTSEGYSTVKIELVLSDAQEDTLTLTSVVSKGNY